MTEIICFKCEIGPSIEWPESFDWHCAKITNSQKTWPVGQPIVFNKGTDNECTAEYIMWSRIDGYPIFRLLKGEKKNVESNASWYINEQKFESKNIKFLDHEISKKEIKRLKEESKCLQAKTVVPWYPAMLGTRRLEY